MGFLLLAVAALVGLMMTLKLLAVKGISSSKAIIINYLIATTIGWLRVVGTSTPISSLTAPLLLLAVGIGLIFYISLLLDARSSAVAGLALTTVATRAAMVIPIALSALLLGEQMSAKSAVLVAIVVGAMVMIFYEKRGGKQTNLLLPFMVFLMAGTATFSLKFSQHLFGTTEAYPFVEPLLFGAALLFATGDTLRKDGAKALRFDKKTIIAGIALGTFNFLTTFFTLQGLRFLPTTTFYPIYYGTAVVVTTILGAALFGEKISPRRLIGIGVALGAIVIISAN